MAIAYKLGEMAETYQLPQEEEEKWLVYSVEEMLRVVRDEQQAKVRVKVRSNFRLYGSGIERTGVLVLQVVNE